MLETLFKRPAILARYRDAPFLDAREKFLKQCALSGYPRSSLKKTAWILLSLAYSMNIDCDRLTVRDIELAIDNRKHFSPPRNSPECKSTRQLFVHVANEWACSLGLIEQTSIESPFSVQIAVFAQYQREERGLSPVTISTRCECLAWFFKSLMSNQASLYLISLADVDAFMESKRSHGWKRSSLTILTDSLRSFFRYAESQGWCAPGIAAFIEAPRIYAQEGIPEGPNWEDVQRLLANSHGDLPADVRNYAIMMLLAVYRFRRGEVARLQLDDLDWTGERIRVTRSKISRIHYVPLVPAVGDAVLRYLREVRPRCSERTLFLSLKAPIRPLSAMSISPIVRSRLKVLGVVLPHSGAHCLRHACASHLLASGFTLGFAMVSNLHILLCQECRFDPIASCRV